MDNFVVARILSSLVSFAGLSTWEVRRPVSYHVRDQIKWTGVFVAAAEKIDLRSLKDFVSLPSIR